LPDPWWGVRQEGNRIHETCEHDGLYIMRIRILTTELVSDTLIRGGK
jgi:hypothetical protein